MSTTFEVRNYCIKLPIYQETAPEWAKPAVSSDKKEYTKIEVPDDVVIQTKKGILNFFVFHNAKTYEPEYFSDSCYYFYHKYNNKLFGYAIPRRGKIEAIFFLKR